LLLASIAGSIYLQQRGHPVAAGIVLGSMIPMKYVGAFFLIYFAWRKEWRLVMAGVLACIAVIGITWWLQGGEVFRVFLQEVLPRHLQGEIQDPFAIQFQSWNSLLRRMFVYSESLNPQPPFRSELLFLALKNLIVWLWLAAFVLIYRQSAFSKPEHQRLFELGLLPLAILLISPGSATYHFLLLSLTIVCFVKILLDLQQQRRAILLAALFVAINLPHILTLKKFASGWLTPLGYMRLWLLVAFFAVICYYFHRPANWRWLPLAMRNYFLAALLVAAAATTVDYHRLTAKERDGAQWVPLHEEEFDRHFGLLVKTPDLGTQRLVFSYGEGFDGDYAIFSATVDGKVQGHWTPSLAALKFYDPDLAADDQRVLMEAIRNGRAEIFLSQGKGDEPEFLLAGENPSWHFDGSRFAFIREEKIGLANFQERGASEPLWLVTREHCYDLAFSPIDHRLAYCAKAGADQGFVLAVADVATGDTSFLLQSDDPFERPAWSPDAKTIVFSWNRNGNRDLWAIEVATLQMQCLTRNPAIDTAPVWDELHRRILFTSDRGRGLEFSTIFWIPAPKATN